jgi:hypothetical protein
MPDTDFAHALHTPPDPLTRSRKQVVSELMSEAQSMSLTVPGVSNIMQVVTT